MPGCPTRISDARFAAGLAAGQLLPPALLLMLLPRSRRCRWPLSWKGGVLEMGMCPCKSTLSSSLHPTSPPFTRRNPAG